MMGLALCVWLLVLVVQGPGSEGASVVGVSVQSIAGDTNTVLPSSHRKWNYNIYDYRKGPHAWEYLVDVPDAKTCAGKRQSPINIVRQDVQINHLNRVRVLYPYRGIYGELKNKGTAPCFLLPWDNTNYRIANVPNRPGQEYILTEIQAHFNHRKRTGSEHTIDGDGQDCELHFIHYNAKYQGSTINPNLQKDGIAIIAVLLKTHSYPGIHKPLSDFLWYDFGRIRKVNHKLEFGHFPDPNTIVNANKYFYSYDGSLDTPPCYESVAWIIKKDPVPATRRGIRSLGMIEAAPNEPVIKYGNNRPIQKRNDRVVEANFIPWFDSILFGEAEP